MFSRGHNLVLPMSDSSTSSVSDSELIDAELKEVPAVKTVAFAEDATAKVEAPASSPKVEELASGTQVEEPVAVEPTISEKLLQSLKKNPVDLNTWTELIEASAQSLDELRSAYDGLLAVFPASSKHWIAYIQLELDHHNFERVETLFKKCLPLCPALPLFLFYLTYIRRFNPLPEGREVISDAYTFALSVVGHDSASGELWSQSIQFIKDHETNGTWEESKKMDQLRSRYQQAVIVPHDKLESLWKDYDTFENSLGRITVSAFPFSLAKDLGPQTPCMISSA